MPRRKARLRKRVGFIGKVIEAETPEDLLERMVVRLPKDQADRVRQIAKDPDQDVGEEEGLRLMSLYLPEADRHRFLTATKEEQEELLEGIFPLKLRFRLQVLDSFEKRFSGTVEVHTELTSCMLTLEKGEVWYLNPSEDEGVLKIAQCGSNRVLRFPDSERRLHDATLAGSKESRIEGTAGDLMAKDDKVYANAAVEARSSSRSFTTITNRDGAFELNGLPPDSYQMRLTVDGKRHDLQTINLCGASTAQGWLHLPVR